jgi:hypothetical protein
LERSIVGTLAMTKCGKFSTAKRLSHAFPDKVDKKEDALSLLLFNFSSEYATRKAQ